ncbi:MAG: hypothetical protein J5927_06680 [Oscillospiraceae bacterium]|nr:hypothetical protein [Oscillospiraceae bacterium]
MALVLLFSSALFSVSAYAEDAAAPLDLNTPCGMTVLASGDSEQRADLAENAAMGVVTDLYVVAEAKKTAGYDTYDYELLEPYRGLAQDLSNVCAGAEGYDWPDLAQKAMTIALTQTPVKTAQPVEIPIENLGPGLYLILSRSADLTEQTDYVVEEEQVVRDAQGRQVTKTLRLTLAHSASRDYRFAPQLISLPTKTEAVDANGRPVINIAYGTWVYTPTVVLKPEQGTQMGDLEIVKNLDTYVGPDPATFVFQVEARWTDPKTQEQKTVYSDVAVLTFTDAGEKSKLIEGKIPVGAVVTVTEVYSGAHYRPVSPQTQTVTIAAVTQADGQTVRTRAPFTNTYDNTFTGGQGIVNHFTYQEGKEGITWYCEKRIGAEAES